MLVWLAPGHRQQSRDGVHHRLLADPDRLTHSQQQQRES